jgi:CHAD domain-containing protein
MVPAMAGFIADGTEPQTWDDILAAALAALGEEFTVAPERALAGRPSPGPDRHRAAADGLSRAIWYDTFDWRLNKAGVTLAYVPGRSGSELRLSSARPDAGQDVTQPVTGWQPSRPHLIGDLAGGPVGARLASLMAMRALIPVVATATTTAVYRLLNGDGKTVARLLVDQPAVTGTGPSAASGPPAGPLPPRLSVTEVRGYQAQARRAVRLLTAVGGLRAGTEPPFADALRLIGRRPGDYSNKVDAEISADMPAAGAAAAILLRLLDTIDANGDGVLADTDSEFLHDLRVSVRRTRSALKLFGDALALSPQELAFYAAEFKWVGDLTTPTRDLDVHLLDFPGTVRSLTAARPDDLEPFRAYLEGRRRREFRALTRGLRSPRYTALIQEWRARLNKIQQDSVGSAAGRRTRSGYRYKPAGGTARLLAAERTRAAFVKVAKRGAAITPQSPAQDLHDLRKRCKELRYALEFFAPLHEPGGYAKVVGDLKRLQDCLGEFQDTQVQIEEIRSLGAAMLAAHQAPAVTLLAMGEVTAGLAARQRAARADFERRFAAFADVAGQRRMAALLRGSAA